MCMCMCMCMCMFMYVYVGGDGGDDVFFLQRLMFFSTGDGDNVFTPQIQC